MKPRGGAREGAGRKSKAEEFGLAEKIDLALGENWTEEVLKAIYKEAKAGSLAHGQLILAYKYGKPKENIDIDLNSTQPFTMIVKSDTE